MNYTKEEVLEYIEQDDVRFIRLAFCDWQGNQKNIAILPTEFERAFNEGISFDASAVSGFTDEGESDLFLFPIPSTLTVLPWRSFQGKVVRMFCEIRRPNGTIFEKDSRSFLLRAEKAALDKGVRIEIGSEVEFYLFKTDEKGLPTKIPFDQAGYMDVAPADKGENIRREMCQTLAMMDILPEASHHEEGPGQNEIDFHYSLPVKAADNVMNFITVVKAISEKSGLYADFSPKPLLAESGNGFHINLSVRSIDSLKKGDNPKDEELAESFMAGLLAHITEITAYLNPTKESYQRLGKCKAPKYITWSPENRSHLIRVPAVNNAERKRMELRSPDPEANPYLAFALVIYAGLDGIEKKIKLPKPINVNLFKAHRNVTKNLEKLPQTLQKAQDLAAKSAFVKEVLKK